MSAADSAPPRHIHFITGRLAEHALREVVPPLAATVGFHYSIEALPITVAALMTPAWIARHARIPAEATRVLLPGYCTGDLAPLAALTRAEIVRGPADLRQLPRMFLAAAPPPQFGDYDIQILAEINHAPRLSRTELLRQAAKLAADGADLIDVGCEPGEAWRDVGDAVRALRDAGLRVSIDSMNVDEIGDAVAAGAELVLSVNSANRVAARDWGVEVVAVPDDPATLAGLDETVDFLARAGLPLRIDPILEPIGFGFAASLGRYLEIRRRYGDAEILMGIGNLTELTEVDSAGINALLIGFCQEQGIRSLLTTEVINWARTSVRECDAARRLMHYAVTRRALPKHVDSRLVMLRDPRVDEPPTADVERLAGDLRDRNYRLFAAEGEIHLVAAGLHLHDADPFQILDRLRTSGPGGAAPKGLDAAHAFYLGYEMCQAATALALGKSYRQDEPLAWGLIPAAERRHRLKFQRATADPQEPAP